MIEISDRILLKEKLTEVFMLKYSLKIWKFSEETGLPKDQYPELEDLDELLGVSYIPYNCLFCLETILRSTNSDVDCDYCLARNKIPSFKTGIVEFCTSDDSAIYAYDSSKDPDKIKKYASLIVIKLEQLLKENNGREDSL